MLYEDVFNSEFIVLEGGGYNNLFDFFEYYEAFYEIFYDEDCYVWFVFFLK